jgi:hypothetical protein
MEQIATAPATSNTTRGAEQSGNIAKQRFARMVKRLEAVSWHIGRLDKQVVGSAT